jgi:hypothetical protein
MNEKATNYSQKVVNPRKFHLLLSVDSWSGYEPLKIIINLVDVFGGHAYLFFNSKEEMSKMNTDSHLYLLNCTDMMGYIGTDLVFWWVIHR